MPSLADPLIVLLLGPTGSGKTALSLALAQRFGGEILSCDSVSVYRGMELGTAKPSAAERAAVPHHLLDIVDPPEPMTAGDWARRARTIAHAIANRRHLPIVTGGTGLYLRAFTEGLAPLPPRCPALRERLSGSAITRTPDYLHRILRRLDAAAALRIHPADQPKLIRAIEVALLGGKPISSAGRNPLQGFRLLRIGLAPPRAMLYERLKRRATAMFDAGLLEETQQLQQQWGENAVALGALGYREAAAVLAGRMPREEAVRAVQQGHRNYAKRQMTWFRREPDVSWLEGFGDDAATISTAEHLVRNHLKDTGSS